MEMSDPVFCHLVFFLKQINIAQKTFYSPSRDSSLFNDLEMSGPVSCSLALTLQRKLQHQLPSAISFWSSSSSIAPVGSLFFSEKTKRLT